MLGESGYWNLVRSAVLFRICPNKLADAVFQSLPLVWDSLGKGLGSDGTNLRCHQPVLNRRPGRLSGKELGRQLSPRWCCTADLWKPNFFHTCGSKTSWEQFIRFPQQAWGFPQRMSLHCWQMEHNSGFRTRILKCPVTPFYWLKNRLGPFRV